MTEDEIKGLLGGTIFQRAKIYHRDGRVISLDATPGKVKASVVGSGSNLYTVTIDLDGFGDLVGMGCNCPYPGFCKHIGAVLFDFIKREPVRPLVPPDPDSLPETEVVRFDTGLESVLSVPDFLGLLQPQSPLPGTHCAVFLLEKVPTYTRRGSCWMVSLRRQYIKKNGERGALSPWNNSHPAPPATATGASLLASFFRQGYSNTLPAEHCLGLLIRSRQAFELYQDHKDGPRSLFFKKCGGFSLRMALSPDHPPDRARFLPQLAARSGKATPPFLDPVASLIMAPETIALLDSDNGTIWFAPEKNGCGHFLSGLTSGHRGYSSGEAEAILRFAADTHPQITVLPLLREVRIQHILPDPIVLFAKRFNGTDATLFFRYGSSTVTPTDVGEHARDPEMEGRESLQFYSRNRECERFYLNRFEEIISVDLDSVYSRIFNIESSNYRHLGEPLKDVLLEYGRDLSEAGFYLSTDKLLQRHINNKAEFDIKVTSGIDWLDLRVEKKNSDGTATPISISRAREGIVEVNGQYHLLPRALLEELGILQEGEAQADGSLRISRFRPDLIEKLYTIVEKEPGEARPLLDLARVLLGIKDLPQVPCPEGFIGKLRPYQQTGLERLAYLSDNRLGVCLADDMGLGKTVQTIALVRHLIGSGVRGPFLIVVPVSTLFNWQEEFTRFAPGTRTIIHRGPERIGSSAALKKEMVLLTSYHTVRNDIEIFSKVEFPLIILDEAQAIKNSRTKIFKAIRCLKGERRITLTGTPIENSITELWSQSHFLNPGLLGTQEGFRKEFLGQIEQAEDASATERLRRKVGPFILRRTKEEVAPELPEKEEVILYAEMGATQRKLYDRVKGHYRDLILSARASKMRVFDISRLVLEGMLRLRQICLFPELADKKWEGVESCKLERLREILPEIVAGGHKSLIFSQFTGVLKRIREGLSFSARNYCYLDGGTRTRREEVLAFQGDPEKKMFLISLKAGGTGLNLTAAEYVFLFDPWWNPAVEAQAIDRAHRIGQKNRVIAYRLVVKDSIEEKILQLQKKKKRLASSLITSEEGFMQKMTEAQILGLFA